MKIRKELNRQLYRQKAYGYEKKPYYFDEAVLNAILDGDVETLKSLTVSGSVSLSAGMRILSKNELKNGKYHYVIAAAFLAETGIGAGLSHDESYMIADIYSRKADRAATCGDLQVLLEDMCLDFAERIQEIKKENVASAHIRTCIDHIYEDLGADLSVKELADLTSLNVSYLCKLFKQETGKTIKEYVTAAKMDTAQNLLKYSDLSCSEIAASLGYCSQSAFTYAFRLFTGTTPGKYRG
jgi:YesN/AraC family two-component response regulator